jgi:signal transduction histidine kinase/DNA-binding response OmpR family regulator/HAMP domain-containing protein
MKIKTKLLLGLSTLPVLIIFLISIGWFQLYSLNKMSESTQTDYELTFLVEEIHREVKNEAISLRNLLLLEESESIQKELSILQKKSDATSQNIALLESKVSSEEQKKLVHELKITNQKFNDYKESLLFLISTGEKEEAIQVINENGHSLHEEFFRVITEITESFEANLKFSFSDFLKDFQYQILIGSLLSLFGIIIVIAIVFRSVWSIAKRLKNVSDVMSDVASGKSGLDTKAEVISDDEIDDVAKSFNSMVHSLEQQKSREQSAVWIKSNIAAMMTDLSGKHDLESLSRSLLSKLAPLMESSHAVFYVKELAGPKSEPLYKLLASYAFKERKHLTTAFHLGEGLIGQAALEKSPIILTDVPADYIRVKSGLGEAPPLNIYVLPVIFDGDVKAVLELASFKPFTNIQQTFLEEMMTGLGIILDSVMGRIQLANLLEETQVLMEEIQAQSEELQSQQEELRVTNEELEEQTQSLRQSEEKLQVQQEELEQTNVELKEKAKILESQNQKLGQTNREVEKARIELEEKAKQLTLSSKYKSEFLANMSHELRTPLNSLLILSKLLTDNVDGNLSNKQVEYSKTIHSAGRDLLELINDILDLAKIESGKMDVNPSKVMLEDLVEFVDKSFRPIANEKNLHFNIVLKDPLPDFIYSDEQRLRQVLKNLLSNAFKFTSKGKVTLEIGASSMGNKESMLSFSVIDTGIGIAEEKQELIFHAFQQADGTTSRKYGGTGLGLSICREISNLLGGELKVESVEGKGSKFSFIVGDYKEEPQKTMDSFDEVAVTKEIPLEKSEAIIIDSVSFVPKKSPATEMKSGIKRLLIVDDDLMQRNSLMELIGEKNVIIKAVSTGTDALEELKVNQYDGMVLDLGLSDINGFSLLEKIKLLVEGEKLKVFIYTGRNLSTNEENYLNKYAHIIIIKDELAPQRLNDELELFLNTRDDVKEQDVSNKTKIKELPGLEGKKILLVDDDVRNVYAISSILELYGMNITFAENGLEAMDLLMENRDFDLILMDIMMPEMDGYEAIRRLRQVPELKQLPVIALTAKAMKDDREKCIQVGASDYIAKPVQAEQLISLMRVWLYPDERES